MSLSKTQVSDVLTSGLLEVFCHIWWPGPCTCTTAGCTNMVFLLLLCPEFSLLGYGLSSMSSACQTLKVRSDLSSQCGLYKISYFEEIIRFFH